MKSIIKSVSIVGQVIGVIVGSKFTTPANQVIELNHIVAPF